MDSIFCAYYDEEMEQDVPLQPSLDEAISFFRRFHWENKSAESGMKLLVFQNPKGDGAALNISSLVANEWDVAAHGFSRRRFFGPFFKRIHSEIFPSLNAAEAENLIRVFYQSTPGEFIEFLKTSASPVPANA